MNGVASAECTKTHPICVLSALARHSHRTTLALPRLEMLFPQWSLLGNETGGRNVWIVKPGTNSKSNGIECMSPLAGTLPGLKSLVALRRGPDLPWAGGPGAGGGGRVEEARGRGGEEAVFGR